MVLNFICHFDGACEPKNPGGAMGIGAIIQDVEGNTLDKLSHYVPARASNSNNVAEYQAFGWTIKRLVELVPIGSTVTILGDSQLVVKQMNGEWGIKDGLYADTAKRAKCELEALRKKCDITIAWIPREQNSLADDLSKKPMKENNIKFQLQKEG